MDLDIPTILIALTGVFLISFMKGAFGGGFAIIGAERMWVGLTQAASISGQDRHPHCDAASSSPAVKMRSMFVVPGRLNGTPAQTMTRSPFFA